MEMVSECRAKTSYYYSGADKEILDDGTLNLSCDEDTWLYKIEVSNYNGRFQPLQDSQFRNLQTPNSGSVDSRTFTRRKHCSLRPSLESVVESPLANRSSLGLLNASTMLNDALQNHLTPTLEKTSLNFTVSDKKLLAPRVFKLNSPFMNSPSPLLDRVNKQLINQTFERVRIDSESSESSVPLTIENFSPFEKNAVMTDSLINFLEKQEVNCCPPTAFQDENDMTNSLVSLPENCDHHNILIESEQLTNSMISFLAPVNCKPPSGFEDTEMTNSVVNVDEEDGLPGPDLTNSVMDYLENVKSNKQNAMSERIALSETENIPPDSVGDKIGLNSHCAERLKASGDIKIEESRKLNSTFDVSINKEGTFNSSNDNYEMANINYTNTVNITHKRKEHGDIEDNITITKSLNCDKDVNSIKDNNEKSLKAKALNNRDLNVTRDLKVDEIADLNSTKTLTKESTQSRTISTNNTTRNATFTREDLNETISLSKQLPSRNSTFNTTFTKLQSPPPTHNSTLITPPHSKAHRVLNSTFAKSSEGLNGGIEDDQTSSASDSSFSSGSTKPRSVDELRTIAKQQESRLVKQTSTPTEANATNSNLVLDLELSPIRSCESRSANCSPVRKPARHPISRLQQPAAETRRQQLQASSLSNIARPKMSGLRMPQPVSGFNAPKKIGVRPTTAGLASVTGIPRPQTSRLPMPCFRRSGIPGPKHSSAH